MNVNSRGLATIGIAAGTAAVVAVGGGIAIASAPDADQTREYGWRHHGGPVEPPSAETVAAATAAAEAEVPDAAVEHVMPMPGGGYAVRMVKSDDSRVVVLLDAQFAIAEVRDAPLMQRPEEATGSDARKARQAARKAVRSSSVERVLVRPEGGYAVFMTKRNGQHRVVLLDDDFAVADVVTGPGGPGGPPGEPVTGKTRKRVEAAALQEVPGGEVVHAHKESRGYDVILRTDNGIVKVELDKQFRVTGTQSWDGPGGRGHLDPGGMGPGFGPLPAPEGSQSPAAPTT